MSHFAKRFSAFAVLTVCFILFQNMTPLTGGIDIREIAPEKPEGYKEFSMLPHDLYGNSPEAIGRQVLEHNFGDFFHELEIDLQYKVSHWGKSGGKNSNKINQQAPINSIEQGWQKKPARFVLRLINPQHLRFSYEEEFKLSCDYISQNRGVQISLNKSIGPRSEISLQHQTDRQESTLNYLLNW